MRKIKVIFSKADKELAEKLHCKYKKLSDRYFDLTFFFRIIAWIALMAGLFFSFSAMFAFIASAAVKNIAVAGIVLMPAIVLFLTSVIFQMMHNDYFASALH